MTLNGVNFYLLSYFFHFGKQLRKASQCYMHLAVFTLSHFYGSRTHNLRLDDAEFGEGIQCPK
jgi:hypothetical protein